jgi:hypothetical protein
MKNLSEKRTDQRKSLAQAVSFELSTVEAGRIENVVIQGLGVDVSDGGMGMTTQYPLKGGEVVKIFFPVTEGETRVPILTEVMWSKYCAGEYRSGLRFLV